MTLVTDGERMATAAPTEPHPEALGLVADATATGRTLVPFWRRVVGAGRANEALRADWQRHLRLVHAACGFDYVRFHGLFHDDMFVYRIDDNGVAHYNFQYVDAVVDALLEEGVRPFVELGFSPSDLARETATIFWWKGHGSPPHDLGRWSDLVSEIVRHWISRYGTEEVRRWYFEVWNEPNLAPFFRGTRSEYFELYAVTARAIKAIDSQLRVGGPATSNFVPDARFHGEQEDLKNQVVADPEVLDQLDFEPVWIREFLEYAEHHELSVDFVSCHPYPTDWALDEHGQGARLTRGVEATPRDLRRLRAIIDQSRFAEAELHLTEWSSSSSSRDHAHDQLPAATFIVRSVLRSLDLVDSLAYWTFTDVFEEQGAGDELFHGGFGMITLPGVVKPTFHAYRMLNALGPELIAQAPGVAATRWPDGRLAVLGYHYPPEEPRSVPAALQSRLEADVTAATGRPRRFDLTVDHLPIGTTVTVEVLDHEHGNAIAAWRRSGAAARPDRDQLSALRREAAATAVRTVQVTERPWRLELDLPPWALVLITTSAPEDPEHG